VRTHLRTVVAVSMVASMSAVAALTAAQGVAPTQGAPAAQGQPARGGRAAGPNRAETGTGRAIPRTAWDGKPDFSGVWHLPTMMDRTPDNTPYNLRALERLYRPETSAMRSKMTEASSPDYRCAPQSYPMAFTVPHPIQLVQTPDSMLILTEYLQSYRFVPMDGNPHEGNYKPSYQGQSVGRWDGDTLVVDVTGFNGRQWLGLSQQRIPPARNGAWPASDAARITERWRLVDGDTLEYQAVVEDPKMLTAPWTSARIRRTRLAYDVVQEDICIEDGEPAILDKLEKFSGQQSN
jgi:hypothetical protein